MKYDPFWLQKLKAKKFAQAERELSHIVDPTKPGKYSTMLCGKGWGAKGHPSICVCPYPSLTNLPTCRQCREKFLTSIGVEFDEATGYPKTSVPLT